MIKTNIIDRIIWIIIEKAVLSIIYQDRFARKMQKIKESVIDANNNNKNKINNRDNDCNNA
jgi:uncharacterized ion transporter superfamily protein YfcC